MATFVMGFTNNISYSPYCEVEPMNEERKKAKNFLRKSTRTQFYDVINEAKLVPLQQEIIIDYFVNGKSQIQIAMERNLSIERVGDIIQSSYDQVMNVLRQL